MFRSFHYQIGLLLLACCFGPVAARGDEWADLSKRSSQFREDGKYAEAEKIERRLLSMAREQGSEVRIAVGLESLGLLASDQGHYAEAEKLLKQSLEIWRTQKDCDDAVAEVINGLGTVYDSQGRVAEAEKMYRQALEIQRKLFGEEHQWNATTLNNLGTASWHFANYTQALDYFEQARKMREKLLGTDNAEVAQSLNNIGFVYYAAGKYAEAETYHRKALAMREKAQGPNHPAVAWSLNNLADMCLQQGRFAEAEKMHQRALQIREKALGPNHPDVAWSLQNLGNLYEDQGKFSQAEAYHQRALKIREQTYGPNHTEVALSLNHLANLQNRQGNYPEAERLRLRVLKINESSFGPDHPDVALALSNLAQLYVEEKKYAEADPLERRALKIREAKFGHENQDVATSLMGLAFADAEQGKFAEAEALAKDALAIREKVLVAGHAEIAMALKFLGRTKYKQHRFDEAKADFDRAIATLEKAEVNPDALFSAYSDRAELLWKMNRVEPSLADLSRALQILEGLRTQVAGGEKERADFLADNARAPENMLQWQVALKHVDDAFAAAERCRGRTLIEQMRVQGTDLLSGLPAAEAKQLNDRDVAARAKVASLEQQLEVLPKRQDLNDEQKRVEDKQLNEALAAARQEQIDAYRAIRDASPAYRLMLGNNFKPVELPALQEWVKKQNALLLQYFFGEDAGYLFVVSPDAPPQVLKLEMTKEQAKEFGVDIPSTESSGTAVPGLSVSARNIKLALTLNGQDLPQRMSTAEKDDALIARLAALWKLLVPEAQREALTTGKYERLILVPDGALVNLPFETLVVETADNPVYLLDRGPPIVAGPSATLLFNLSQREAGSKDLNNQQQVLTVGNPTYPDASKSSGNTSRSASNSTRGSTDLLTSFRPNARYATRGSLKPLPHSGTEVSWVAEAFSKNGLTASKLLKTDATEANLRTSAPGREILHLACHGLVDAEHGNFFGALALTPGAKAGANPADDGFLTLPEIYELNLKGNELAILSACQTNYGPQQRGEGVWALSRGFLVAGSRRVVASNWLVDDEAAASLVYYFCSSVAQAGNPTKSAENTDRKVDYAKALHDAKLWIRHQAKWQHPYYWATFTLIGPN